MAFFIFVLVLAVACVAIVLAVKWARTSRDSRRRREDARGLLEAAQARYSAAADELETTLDELGGLRLNVATTWLAAWRSLITLVVDPSESASSRAADEPIRHDDSLTPATEAPVLAGAGLTRSAIAGATMGGVAAVGSCAAVGSLGVASTGAYIGTLSGAAATNATLAALGGGAIASGGFGMAAGAAVLGVTVLAPTAAVVAWTGNRRANKSLNEVVKYEREATDAATQLNEMSLGAAALQRTASVAVKYLAEATELFRISIAATATCLARTSETTDRMKRWKSLGASGQATVARSIDLATLVAELLIVPVMDADGTPSRAFEDLPSKWDLEVNALRGHYADTRLNAWAARIGQNAPLDL